MTERDGNAAMRRVVLSLVERHSGFTAGELAEIGALGAARVADSLDELAASGLVKKGDPRLCGIGHEIDVTWWRV